LITRGCNPLFFSYLFNRRGAPPRGSFGGVVEDASNFMYFAYILISLKDGKYYYGSTSDIEKRLSHHNSGKVKSTKYRKPFKIHYLEQFRTKKEAELKEKYFKSIEGYKWLKQNNIT
jgi:putative endonuclease